MKHSNALQNSGSKKTHFVCNEETIFLISHNCFCNVKLVVAGDFEWSSLFSFFSHLLPHLFFHLLFYDFYDLTRDSPNVKDETVVLRLQRLTWQCGVTYTARRTTSPGPHSPTPASLLPYVAGGRQRRRFHPLLRGQPCSAAYQS